MLDDNEEKKNEQSILCPTNPYAATKAGAEMLRNAEPNAQVTASQNAQSLMMGGIASNDGVGAMPIISMPQPQVIK
jgi:hypothetical protein